MQSYLIRFTDGSFHYYKGVGFSTNTVREAKHYYDIKEAMDDANHLNEVEAIVRNSFLFEVVKSFDRKR